MNFKMVHENYNVSDLEKSLKFYEEALGLHESRRIENENFTIVMLKMKAAVLSLSLLG